MSAGSPALHGIDPVSGEGSEADAEPPIGISLEVVHEAGAWEEPERLAALAQSAADALFAEIGGAPTSRSGTACVALSSDEEVARLNEAYRGKPKPTNVLSFPAGPLAHGADQEARFLGDIVLARETVVREAAERGLPLNHHLQHLIVHGLLHLLGHDHETEEEAALMEALETRALARLGIADPYASEEADTP
jgi:probable rRNA maturation factor